MLGRNVKADEDGNEWMNVAQYKRAAALDFDTAFTQTLIVNYRKAGKFNTIHMKKIAGKDCINYTQTVIQFFSSHPAIAPSDFETIAKEWRKKLKPKAKKTISAKIKALKKDDPKDDYEATQSVAIEKAKHEKIKREVAEFNFEVVKGNYIHLDDIVPLLETIAVETRQAVKAMIPRINPIVTAGTDLHANKKVLEEETDTALNHLHRIQEITDSTYQDKVKEAQMLQIENET